MEIHLFESKREQYFDLAIVCGKDQQNLKKKRLRCDQVGITVLYQDNHL